MREVADPFAHRKQTLRIVDHFRRPTDLRCQFPIRSPPTRMAHKAALRTSSSQAFAGFAPLRETKIDDPRSDASR